MSKERDAKTLFGTMCRTLDNMNWTYKTETSDGFYIIRTSAVGEDLSMGLVIRIDINRALMYLKSPMPFSVPENKRAELGAATVIANMAMLNGCFEYDYSDGYCAFKLIIPFEECTISEKVCKYMIYVSCDMVDKFNDKMKALAEGNISLSEYNQQVRSMFG